MKRHVFALGALLCLSCCSSPNADDPDQGPTCQALQCADAAGVDAEADSTRADAGSSADAAGQDADNAREDAASPDTGTTRPTLMATEAYEADILYGWVAAGQPTETRVAEVVETGATIISLRLQNEDPFDEPALIENLGGVFIRYPTNGSDYDTVAFRESMYDLYDEQLDAGTIVYLHCASSNRVGASWALYQAERKGVDPEEAIAMGKAAGLTSLESRVRQILGI